jgi:large subunit ribosomal protein L15
LRTIIKRLPKLRGYRFHSFQDKAAVVNVGALETAFAKNDKVTPESLKAKKLVSYPKGSKPVVKILATGEITIPLLVSGCKVSKQAQDKIVAAGGAVK